MPAKMLALALKLSVFCMIVTLTRPAQSQACMCLRTQPAERADLCPRAHVFVSNLPKLVRSSSRRGLAAGNDRALAQRGLADRRLADGGLADDRRRSRGGLHV